MPSSLSAPTPGVARVAGGRLGEFLRAWLVLTVAVAVPGLAFAGRGLHGTDWIDHGVVATGLAAGGLVGECLAGPWRRLLLALALASMAVVSLGWLGGDAWWPFAPGLFAVGLALAGAGGGCAGWRGLVLVPCGALTAVGTWPWVVELPAGTLLAGLAAVTLLVGALDAPRIVGRNFPGVVATATCAAALGFVTLPDDGTLGACGRATAVLLALVAFGQRRWRLAALVVVGGLAWTWQVPAVAPTVAPGSRWVAGGHGHAVIYRRGDQELQLVAGQRVVAADGPDRPHAPLAATLVRAFALPGDRVALLGLGTGRLAEELRGDPRFVVDCVDARPGIRPLRAVMRGAGPVTDPRDVGVAADRILGLLPALGGLVAGSRQVVVCGELVGSHGAWQAAVEGQAELRRVAGVGLVVQPFDLEYSAPDQVAAWLQAVAVAHPWSAVFTVGPAAVVVSAGQPLAWPTAADLTAWPLAARWTGHAAHLTAAEDFRHACAGRLLAQVVPADQVAAVLASCLEPLDGNASPEEAVPGCYRDWTASRRQLAAFAARLQTAGDAEQAGLQAAAARWLPRGAPSAALQAALGLPDGDGISLYSPGHAALCAQAIDPTFVPPPVCRSLPRPAATGSPLEDLAGLPPDARLAVAASGNGPFAVALRARFPSAVARALVAALAAGPLPPAGVQALRELADPFVLARAGDVLEPAGRQRELLALWRGDLPMPAALSALATAAPDDRRQLYAALGARVDRAALEALATALLDPEADLRAIAAASLQATAGERIPYDPAWPRSRRLAAAERVRALHNRAP